MECPQSALHNSGCNVVSCLPSSGFQYWFEQEIICDKTLRVEVTLYSVGSPSLRTLATRNVVRLEWRVAKEWFRRKVLMMPAVSDVCFPLAESSDMFRIMTFSPFAMGCVFVCVCV